jgi:hypothetical protein
MNMGPDFATKGKVPGNSQAFGSEDSVHCELGALAAKLDRFAELAGGPTPPTILVPLEGSELLAQAVRALQWREARAPFGGREKRTSARERYGGSIIVALELPTASSVLRVAFPGKCRNISRGGVGIVTAQFLVPAEHQVLPRRQTTTSLLFNLDRVIELGMSCYVCIPEMQPQPLWLKGEIKRKRVVGGSLLELGIRFTGRFS